MCTVFLCVCQQQACCWLFVYVDLCVGGAAVSCDGRGYSEKEEGEEELETEREKAGGVDSGRKTMAEGERQPDREVVSVYQEHTALAASSLSVVVPSSSLLQHLPARHQAEQDPDPSTAPSQDQSPINCSLLQAQLSSSADSTPHLTVSTPNSMSNPESGPSGLYLFHTDSAPSSPIPSYSPAAEPTSASQTFSLFP